MATWHELSRDSLKTAKRLLEDGDEAFLRSSISRSYYAAYAAITGGLPRGMTFGRERGNPSHEQVPSLVRRNLSSLDLSERRRALKNIKLLRLAREDADYRPGKTVDKILALNCFRCALYICEKIGVEP